MSPKYKCYIIHWHLTVHLDVNLAKLSIKYHDLLSQHNKTVFEARHSQQKFIMAQKPVQLKGHDSTVRRDQPVCRTHFLCERKPIVGFSLRVCSRDAISGHQATPTGRLRAWPSYEHITCAPATGPCTQTLRDGSPATV